MKKLSSKIFFLSLALALSLGACKEDPKKTSDENKQNSQKDPGNNQKNNNDAQSDADAKSDADSLPPPFTPTKEGDQCSNLLGYICDDQGKNLLFCGDGILVKAECGTDFSCHTETYKNFKFAQCVHEDMFFDSCDEAWQDYNIDSATEVCGGAGSEFVEDLPDEIMTTWIDEGYLVGEFSDCVALDNQKFTIETLGALRICANCHIGDNKALECTQYDDDIGAKAQENDICVHADFVPRRIENNKSALYCQYIEDENDKDVEDIGKVAKFTCPENLEVAFALNTARFGDGKGVACIDSKEKECSGDIWVCENKNNKEVSTLVKACANTDKGRHYVAPNNSSWLRFDSQDSVECKNGCNKATGLCK